MANTKLTSLTSLVSAASGDVIYLVDISDTTDSSVGSSRRITVDNFFTSRTITSPTITSPTITGTVILPKTLEIQDTSADHQYVLAVSELSADRTITLPLLTGNDTFVFNDFAATLTNKTISFASNTLTGVAPLASPTFTGTVTLPSGTILTAPKFADLGFIADANGNELIILDTVASAVNELTLANAATGLNPTITMSGETNVGLDLKMKAAGYFRRPTIIEIPVGDSATNLATGDGKAFFRIPNELNGMNLTGVAAAVYTAGTTGTLDVQIRNKTQAADFLSTKITIDSTETDTSTAAMAAVIDTANDDVATGDIVAIDIDAVHTTPAKGLIVQLRFELP